MIGYDQRAQDETNIRYELPPSSGMLPVAMKIGIFPDVADAQPMCVEKSVCTWKWMGIIEPIRLSFVMSLQFQKAGRWTTNLPRRHSL